MHPVVPPTGYDTYLQKICNRFYILHFRLYIEAMLIDDVTIKVKAGSGGTGKVAFNKNLMSLGPAGGTGGKGGSVFFEGTSDLSTLNQFRFKKEIVAKNGENGRGQFCDGPDAGDIFVKV